MITPRAKFLFLLILFFALTVVLAIFGLVIAVIFSRYPESVLSVWVEIPVAIFIGYWGYRKGAGLLVPSLLALALLYLAIYVGVYYWPISLPESWGSPVVAWTLILLAYCFVASVLPVWTLLQPRDYINSHQLMLALSLLFVAILIAGLTNQIDINSAPMITLGSELPPDAPRIWPFLFITIACGAVSGFHCLVSSGTSSKQVACETDAQYVGYGAMLLEGALAVVVILACSAGIGMGAFQRSADGMLAINEAGDYAHQAGTRENVGGVGGRTAWRAYYPTTRVVNGVAKGGWGTHSLTHKVGAFVEGGANLLSVLGMPLRLSVAIIAVLVASFAATTLDTATRLQRYVVQELAAATRITPLTNRYAATLVAVVLGGSMAMVPGPEGGAGTGGLILWPLFGATNQLLAGLAFMVIAFYLLRRKKPIWFIAAPMVAMIVLPTWALSIQMFDAESGWLSQGNYLLFSIGLAVMMLQFWMVFEAAVIWPRAKGVIEESLPPLDISRLRPAPVGGRSC
jgi:carbon starvation protein